MALAPYLQLGERVELGSHKGEDGLLLVAQIHHREVVLGRELVYDGQLHTIKILHLIHLYPVITLACGVLLIYLIRAQEQVLKVEHIVFALVTFILSGIKYLPKQRVQVASRDALQP